MDAKTALVLNCPYSPVRQEQGHVLTFRHHVLRTWTMLFMPSKRNDRGLVSFQVCQITNGTSCAGHVDGQLLDLAVHSHHPAWP